MPLLLSRMVRLSVSWFWPFHLAPLITRFWVYYMWSGMAHDLTELVADGHERNETLVCAPGRIRWRWEWYGHKYLLGGRKTLEIEHEMGLNFFYFSLCTLTNYTHHPHSSFWGTCATIYTRPVSSGEVDSRGRRSELSALLFTQWHMENPPTPPIVPMVIRLSLVFIER